MSNWFENFVKGTVQSGGNPYYGATYATTEEVKDEQAEDKKEDNNPLAKLLKFLKTTFSVENGSRVLAVIVGILLIGGAIVALTSATKDS